VYALAPWHTESLFEQCDHVAFQQRAPRETHKPDPQPLISPHQEENIDATQTSKAD